MPSSYGRSVAVAVFVFVLAVSPYAHAADTSAFGINDPFIDAFELWATVLTSVESLSHQFASVLQTQSSLTSSNSPKPHVPKTLTPPALTASAVVATEPLPETATNSESASPASPTPQQRQSRSPPEAPAATINASLALAAATPASAFVTQGQFNAALSAIGASLQQLLAKANTNTAPVPEYVGGDGNSADPYAAVSAIDQLSNTAISTPTITGGSISGTSISGLTTSSLSDFSYATTSSFVPGIAAWGDSLTQGIGAGSPYPTQLSILAGVTVYNGGITSQTSAQIAARMLPATNMYSWPTIIEAGSNDITGSISADELGIDSNIASMVAALQSVGNNNYVILSLFNHNTDPAGSTNYNEIIQINSALPRSMAGTISMSAPTSFKTA